MSIVKQVPNLITLTSLLLGAISLVFLWDGQAFLVPYLIYLAAIFDFGDGLAAKILNAKSEMGKQLDSLADMVSFGLVPGCVFYYLLTHNAAGSIPVNAHSVSILVPSFFVTLSAAIRLARFNIDPGPRTHFLGMPTPAAALFVVSLIGLEKHIPYSDILLGPYALYIYMVGLSVLMSSSLPMFNLKFAQYGYKGNEIRYIFLGLSVGLIIVLKFAAVPAIILLYILLSIIQKFFKHEVPSGN